MTDFKHDDRSGLHSAAADNFLSYFSDSQGKPVSLSEWTKTLGDNANVGVLRILLALAVFILLPFLDWQSLHLGTLLPSVLALCIGAGIWFLRWARWNTLTFSAMDSQQGRVTLPNHMPFGARQTINKLTSSWDEKYSDSSLNFQFSWLTRRESDRELSGWRLSIQGIGDTEYVIYARSSPP